MICPSCGTEALDDRARCGHCGTRLREDPWAPPSQQAEAPLDADAPFGMTGGRPRRISMLSKVAIVAACLVPPVGFFVGIYATVAARRHRSRPGNLALAIASIFTSLHLGIFWFAMMVVIYEEVSRPSYYDEPWYEDPAYQGSEAPAPANDWGEPGLDPAANAELQRILEELAAQQQQQDNQ